MLYRLEDPVGWDRGWADLEPLRAVVLGDPINLIHHAEGGPLRMSIGKVEAVGLSALTYDTPTAGGVRGAPVLSEELDVLAIHSRKLPAPGGTFLKQGIPIPATLAELGRQGVNILAPRDGSQQ